MSDSFCYAISMLSPLYRAVGLEMLDEIEKNLV